MDGSVVGTVVAKDGDSVTIRVGDKMFSVVRGSDLWRSVQNLFLNDTVVPVLAFEGDRLVSVKKIST